MSWEPVFKKIAADLEERIELKEKNAVDKIDLRKTVDTNSKDRIVAQ